jgi:glycosyltransferase involved in cell wall biosynthesis
MTIGRVSVVIPALRADAYLDQAVRSVLDDGHPDVEVIVVFDGVDVDLAGWSWRGRTDVVITRTTHRSGSAAAINHGIRLATGEYIARLDADDVSHPGRFAAQLDALRTRPETVLVGTQGRVVDGENRVLGDYPADASADVRELLTRTNPVIHSSFLIRRAVLDGVGGYDESCIRMQDYELLLRLALVGPIAITPGRFVDYRVHGGQNSGKLQGFAPLMIRIACGRSRLAKNLGLSGSAQLIANLAFAAAQLLRYLGLRKPRYLAS